MNDYTSKIAINDVLILLVVCSMESERNELAIRTIQNLNKLMKRIEIKLVVFDNGSTIKNYRRFLPTNSELIESPINLGFWSAIYWVLNQDRLRQKYIYIIESDLVHTSLVELQDLKEFLDSNSQINCVRTQEFSNKMRWRYNKNLKFLPFHKTRSEIILKNYVTNEKAWFRKSKNIRNIYISNLHAKIPAFHRWENLRKNLQKLSKMENFTEGDFFQFAYQESKLVGIHIPGLYYSLSSRKNAKTIPASSYLEKSNTANIYKSSRFSTISEYPDLTQ